jgi:hypothetical protein
MSELFPPIIGKLDSSGSDSRSALETHSATKTHGVGSQAIAHLSEGDDRVRSDPKELLEVVP